MTDTAKPLVVDLDGTLVRSDLLIESGFAALGRRPQSVFSFMGALLGGKAALKHRLAAMNGFDPALLPYDDAVLACIAEARAEGRKVYLASASAERLVQAVAEHLAVFDGWFASDFENNLAGAAKATQLVAAFGDQGFDYIGNDKADLAVWEHAAQAIAIRTTPGVLRRLRAKGRAVRELEAERPSLTTWLRLIRVHQYAKNGLILVPLLTAHSDNVGPALLAVMAFSLCASGVYVLNDLVDIAADRGHPSKRHRPLASGAIPLFEAMLAIPLLVAAGLGIALAVGPAFLGVVLIYLALTTAYSFVLKRKLMVDVATLAMLYTIRVIAGSVAIGVVTSKWLLAFSMFIFAALALMKRYTELTTRIEAGLPDPSNRNYRLDDLQVVMAIAAAAGLNAITIFILYINSNDLAPYSRPEALWLLCPLLLYWLGRALILAHRRMMEDDPIVFAVKDRVSRYTVICMLIVILIAI